MLSCSQGAGSTVLVRTELSAGNSLGVATGQARAGPPRDPAAGPYP
jgi:hypothetical protein